MDRLLEVAFSAYERKFYGIANRRQALQFDPVDAVVAGYPPLQTYGAYRINWRWQALGIGMNVFCNCAESALALVLTRSYLDREPNVKYGEENPPVLEAMLPGGATVNEMIRWLQRTQNLHFPVYEYEVARNRFHLLSGKPRQDNNAVVFLPSDPVNGLNVAHWTYTTVLPPLNEDEFAGFDAVVYSRFPVCGEILEQTVLWRAEVLPENSDVFEAQAAMGRACDCDWNLICEHEREFIQAAGTPGRRPNVLVKRITLDGARHVQGTELGSLRGSAWASMRTTRCRNAGMKLHMPGQKVVKQDWVSGLASVRMTGWLAKLYYMPGIMTTNDFAALTPAYETVIWPLRISLRQFLDEGQIEQTTWGSVGAFFKRGLMMVMEEDTQFVVPLEYVETTLDYGATEDLTIRLPRKDELISRLLLRKEVTKDTAFDIVRRMAAEERWDISVDQDELALWLDRVITVKGESTVKPIPSYCCWSCLKEKKTYRHLCKQCRQESISQPPPPLALWDTLVTHVGFRPLWSRDFVLPKIALKADVEVEDLYARKYIYGDFDQSLNVDQLVSRFRKQVAACTCRGYSRGPVFLSQEPKCFPRGSGTAALAFLVRLGVERVHEAVRWPFDQALRYLERKRHITELEPESWELFISHFSGEKRLKNEEGRREEAEGWAPQVGKPPDPTKYGPMVRVGMKGFAKPEKSYHYEFNPAPFLQDKATEKPRFICSPSPLILARIGRWTHAQTKWLAREFTWRDNLYYAGCSTPEELHLWLNRTIAEVPDPYTLVDDISAMDSNHSEESFRFHREVRHRQYPRIAEWIEAVYWGEEYIVVRVGNWRFRVGFVNASGVSDTSYKNSLMCLLIRCLAIAHAVFDLRGRSDDFVQWAMDTVVQTCCMAASGDDGLSRLPHFIGGVGIEQFSLERYSECWAWAGFSVKVSMVPPVRWRMATFLAMRPVWAGTRYEWAPEPARRMRGMFWQFDNSIHPIAWARGIATQVLQQARALPVLSDVCQWYLDNTTGAIANVEATNAYSPFFGSQMTGGQNARATHEFCLDYHVTEGDIERFKRTLQNTRDVLVNLDAFVLQRIYAEES